MVNNLSRKHYLDDGILGRPPLNFGMPGSPVPGPGGKLVSRHGQPGTRPLRRDKMVQEPGSTVLGVRGPEAGSGVGW